jgi:hypothetical protein
MNNTLGKWVRREANVLSYNHLLESNPVGFKENQFFTGKPIFLPCWHKTVDPVRMLLLLCVFHGCPLLLSSVLVILTWPLEDIHTLL